MRLPVENVPEYTGTLQGVENASRLLSLLNSLVFRLLAFTTKVKLTCTKSSEPMVKSTGRSR